ncbi:heterokaryon incompatibility, partial [Dothidotthia symphoricarpi CBS 119687]
SPRYAALSYTWGSAPYNKGRPKGSTYQIVVNGVTRPVQQNLHDALDHLSSKIQDLDIPLFVDAICINQADMHERASQVRQMREIYENAELVVGWLG